MAPNAAEINGTAAAPHAAAGGHLIPKRTTRVACTASLNSNSSLQPNENQRLQGLSSANRRIPCSAGGRRRAGEPNPQRQHAASAVWPRHRSRHGAAPGAGSAARRRRRRFGRPDHRGAEGASHQPPAAAAQRPGCAGVPRYGSEAACFIQPQASIASGAHKHCLLHARARRPVVGRGGVQRHGS